MIIFSIQVYDIQLHLGIFLFYNTDAVMYILCDTLDGIGRDKIRYIGQK